MPNLNKPNGNVKKRLKINLISESVFTVQGHGVHTAFKENYESLSKLRDEVDVKINTNRLADITHIHTMGPYALKHLIFPKNKKIVSAHLIPDCNFIGTYRGAKYWHVLAKKYLRWFYNRADAVFAVSEYVFDRLKQLGVSKPICLVPNTIDVTRYAATPMQKIEMRKKLGFKETDFIILGNGQVQPVKGIHSFVETAKKLKQYRFVWIGGIPFRGASADYSQMKKLMHRSYDNLLFTGAVPHEEVGKYYQIADLFFLPSIRETFGIVIVEAAAAGLPVLLRDFEHYRSTFGDSYVASKEEDFVSQVERFATDKSFYEIWRKKGSIIAEKYNSRIGIKYLLDVYQEVLQA